MQRPLREYTGPATQAVIPSFRADGGPLGIMVGTGAHRRAVTGCTGPEETE